MNCWFHGDNEEDCLAFSGTGCCEIDPTTQEGVESRDVKLSTYTDDHKIYYCLFEHHKDGRIGIIAERIPDIETAKAMELAVSNLKVPICNHESKKCGQWEMCIKCGMHTEDGKVKKITPQTKG